MAIAACLTLAFIHLGIGRKLAARAGRAHLFLALGALAVGATGGFELALLKTDTLERYRALMYGAQFSITVMFIALAGFIRYYFAGRRWLALLVMSLSVVILAVNSIAPAHWRIRYPDSIRAVETFGGAEFTFAHLTSGPLTVFEIITNALLIVFVVEASLRAWQRGRRRQALMIGGGIVFFLGVTRSYAAVVEFKHLETPYFFIFPFLALIVAMGRELSVDVIRAVDLADQLQERDRQVDLAARAATLGFWRWDLKSNALWATDSARVLFGIPNDAPLDFDRFIQWVHPEDRDAVYRAVERTVSSGADYEAEYRIVSAGAPERWISARGRVDASGDGAPAIMRGVVIDVTERKRAQQDVELIRKELAHVSRISMMGELAGSLAHELNQPLAAILSNAQAARWLLGASPVDLAQLGEIVDDIIRDDKRAGEVIHRLRTMLQKRDHEANEVLELNDVAQDVARLLNSEAAARNVDVVLCLAPGLPPVRAGRVEMQQVLLNLMVNGMDAMRDVPAQARRLTVSTGATGEHVTVTVADQGSGIPPALMPDIFRPFFTTKEQGLGMGLAICRSLVEAYAGTLTAGNSPGGGALFTVSLWPAVEGKPS
jgi:signal transduction histidine kinase